jgi:hypothetical protein
MVQSVMGGRDRWPNRFHVVPIPGFGCFDALGQVRYYAGITRLFKAWKAKDRQYSTTPMISLPPRWSRAPHDCEAIWRSAWRAARFRRAIESPWVGHSTGGLDVRQLVADLHEPARKPVQSTADLWCL